MSAHTPEVRAGAVADLASGHSVSEVSRKYGVDRSTLRRWRVEAGIDAPLVHQEKKRALGEQVYELIEDSIRALRVQLRVAGDEEWLKRQSAGELAIFHGVISDKTVRLLASLRPDTDHGIDR